MKTVTIDDLKNHLLKFQSNLECKGETRILKELVVPPTLCEKLSIASGVKLLFVYMGTDTQYPDIHHYLAWLENEGGMLVDIGVGPDHEALKDKEVVLTEKGEIGYGVILPTPVKMEITWENGHPQGKSIRTGAITELADIPQAPLIENIFKLYSDAAFSIINLMFGNPNIILSLPTDMEPCLSYMSAAGNNEECLHDSFYVDMGKNGPALRELIISAGDASPKEVEKIVSKFCQDNGND